MIWNIPFSLLYKSLVDNAMINTKILEKQAQRLIALVDSVHVMGFSLDILIYKSYFMETPQSDQSIVKERHFVNLSWLTCFEKGMGISQFLSEVAGWLSVFFQSNNGQIKWLC